MKQPQIIIIGGGLAGLTAAIHLASANMKVRLYEKEIYPHHKVCGEYLSKEVLPYLKILGIDLLLSKPAEIDQLNFSDYKGSQIRTVLPLGGIGISRYELDYLLYLEALKHGVEVCHDSVKGVEFNDNRFQVRGSRAGICSSEFVLGAYGKRSLIDKKLGRKFISQKSGWLAVKGHYINKNFPIDTVSLHNFKGGYCGLSKTETGAVNVCYLASYKSFKKYKNTDEYKKQVLLQNIHLREFFINSTPAFSRDLSIAQISFERKQQVHDHVIMIGDAAGLIHPLCGNGMAMAIHSAKIASECILANYNGGDFNRKIIERGYIVQWKKNFNSRIRMGRLLQSILLDQRLANFSQMLINRFPFLLPAIIKRTHGTRLI